MLAKDEPGVGTFPYFAGWCHGSGLWSDAADGWLHCAVKLVCWPC